MMSTGIEGFDEPMFVLTHPKEDAVDSVIYELGSKSVPIYDHNDVEVKPTRLVVIYSILFSTYAMMTIASIAFLCYTLFRSSIISAIVSFFVIIWGFLRIAITTNPNEQKWLFALHLNPINHWIDILLRSKIACSLSETFLVLTIWTVLSFLIAL